MDHDLDKTVFLKQRSIDLDQFFDSIAVLYVTISSLIYRDHRSILVNPQILLYLSLDICILLLGYLSNKLYKKRELMSAKVVNNCCFLCIIILQQLIMAFLASPHQVKV